MSIQLADAGSALEREVGESRRNLARMAEVTATLELQEQRLRAEEERRQQLEASNARLAMNVASATTRVGALKSELELASGALERASADLEQADDAQLRLQAYADALSTLIYRQGIRTSRWVTISNLGSWLFHGKFGLFIDLFRLSHSSFDPVRYLVENPDVRDAGMNPWLHFVEHGARELRPAPARRSLEFSGDLGANLEVAGAAPQPVLGRRPGEPT